MVETLVVGAGPVGLTAALELARRGREVRIIERRSAPITESRALGINPRSLDILEPSGVTAHILAEGIRINRARLVSRGDTLGTIAFSATGHRYGFMTALPQARTEALLSQALARSGVAIEWESEFLSVEGPLDAPVARVRTAQRVEDIAVRYLVGCDGAHSAVRESAGIDFRGRVNAHDWVLVDVELDWPYPEDEVDFLLSETGNLFVLPVVPGVRRLVSPGPDPQALLPDGVSLGATLWRSQFRIAHKLARTMAKGAVFLAGDSAHIHSPAGARGMNGGIEDAATLAWLIDIGETGRYGPMREPAARRVLAQVERQTRQAQSRAGVLFGLREAVARVVLPLPMVQRMAAGFITAQDTPAPPWLDR